MADQEYKGLFYSVGNSIKDAYLRYRNLYIRSHWRPQIMILNLLGTVLNRQLEVIYRNTNESTWQRQRMYVLLTVGQDSLIACLKLKIVHHGHSLSTTA